MLAVILSIVDSLSLGVQILVNYLNFNTLKCNLTECRMQNNLYTVVIDHFISYLSTCEYEIKEKNKIDKNIIRRTKSIMCFLLINKSHAIS